MFSANTEVRVIFLASVEEGGMGAAINIPITTFGGLLDKISVHGNIKWAHCFERTTGRGAAALRPVEAAPRALVVHAAGRRPDAKSNTADIMARKMIPFRDTRLLGFQPGEILADRFSEALSLITM